jgi:hypothetical protein
VKPGNGQPVWETALSRAVALFFSALALHAFYAVVFRAIEPISRSGDRRYAVQLGASLLVPAFLGGGWVATDIARPQRAWALGLVLSAVLLGVAIIGGGGVLYRMVNLRDVGVSIGAMDAPNVAVRTSRALEALLVEGMGTSAQRDMTRSHEHRA